MVSIVNSFMNSYRRHTPKKNATSLFDGGEGPANLFKSSSSSSNGTVNVAVDLGDVPASQVKLSTPRASDGGAPAAAEGGAVDEDEEAAAAAPPTEVAFNCEWAQIDPGCVHTARRPGWHIASHAASPCAIRASSPSCPPHTAARRAWMHACPCDNESRSGAQWQRRRAPVTLHASHDSCCMMRYERAPSARLCSLEPCTFRAWVPAKLGSA